MRCQSSAVDLPILALITDRGLCGGEAALLAAVAEAVDGGANLVQVREPDLPAGELWNLARQARDIVWGHALLFVNDRIDVALACGADGAQLPERGLPVAAARRVAGERSLLIGRSVHSPDGAAQATAEQSDLVQLGTIYPTRSHPECAGSGPSLLAEASARCPLPLIAVGGITASRIAECVAAGAAGVAVISAILCVDSPRRAAAELADALREAWSAR